MNRHTDELRSFWDVDSMEQAQHERVTVPARPDAWSDEVQEPETAPIIARFARPPLTVLDYGCGVGRVARQFLRAGYDVVGVDVSPKMLTYAEQYCQPHAAAWVLTDGYTLPWPDSSVQGAYSFYVFQHMPSFELINAALSEIRRCLCPGGTFLLQTIDNRLSETSPAHPSFIGVRQSAGSIRSAVSQAGFRIASEVIHEYEDHLHILLQLTKPA